MRRLTEGTVRSTGSTGESSSHTCPNKKRTSLMAEKKSVMFLCNHNSCRSQMAEGFAKALGLDWLEVSSSGIVGGTAIKPGAVTVMQEVGVDITSQTSDAVADYDAAKYDAVVSCCGCGSKLDGDKEVWKQRTIFQDWNLDDPPAIDPGDLSAYRRVRDETKAKVDELVATMKA
mmetsp:Transcript_36272/g.116193  ORF Transcript_36272/g.116193 Transcript_36272/m.116193 type:complete len:174 (+) Transcript_36272:885-1406(+)